MPVHCSRTVEATKGVWNWVHRLVIRKTDICCKKEANISVSMAKSYSVHGKNQNAMLGQDQMNLEQGSQRLYWYQATWAENYCIRFSQTFWRRATCCNETALVLVRIWRQRDWVPSEPLLFFPEDQRQQGASTQTLRLMTDKLFGNSFWEERNPETKLSS